VSMASVSKIAMPQSPGSHPLLWLRGVRQSAPARGLILWGPAWSRVRSDELRSISSRARARSAYSLRRAPLKFA
jgi:hypothetical protein